MPGVGGVAGKGAAVGSGTVRAFAAGSAGSAAAPLPGILSFWPTLILSLVNPLAARIALAVVPCFLAILLRVSPPLTVYDEVAPAVSGSWVEIAFAVGVAAAEAEAPAAGIWIVWPTFSLPRSTLGLASLRALRETPWVLAIL